MITAEQCYHDMIDNVSREIYARVELLDGSTLLNTFTYDGALKSFTIERQGDSNKFFGYGICTKLTLALIDKDRLIDIKKGQGLDVAIGVGCEYLYAYPIFYVDEIQRDENTNELTITAYDVIYKANNYKVSDMTLPENYNILYFMSAAAALLGIPLRLDGILSLDILHTTYNGGANFDGTESLREALDDVAEVTGMIYYIDHDWKLTFKKMDITGDSVLTIDKSKYFTLSAKTPYNLEKVTHATELGDNITVETGTPGSHQYLRDNAFISNRDDAHVLLQNAFNNVSGLTMYQFDCKWRGNFLLEPGDKIALITKDDLTIQSYVLNDTLTYNGGLVANTSWSYTDNQTETASNPATLGEALKNTFARVDKVNQEISLVVQDSDEMKSTINSLKISTEGIISQAQSIYDELDSKITQTATEIRTEVSDGINGLDTKISQTATEIRSEVADDISGLDSKITQNSNSISSVVSNQNEFSEFQQTVESFKFMNKGGTVMLSGGDINLTGAIRFSDLSDATSKQSEIDTAKSNASTALTRANSANTTANDAMDTVSGWAHADNGTYIDGDMIYSDSIYADAIHLGGVLTVYKTRRSNIEGGYLGYDSGFNSTYGIGIRDVTESSQVVCTESASRLSYGNPSSDANYSQFVASSSGYATIEGSDAIFFKIDGTTYVALADHSTYGSLRPYAGAPTMHLGTAAYRWGAVYADNGQIQTSDQNKKNSIEDLPDKYLVMFDKLHPKRFKMNNGTSGRYHVGYISNEVEAAMAEAGIDSTEFGGFVKDKDEDGNDIYMLRYDEFDAIRDAKIKQLEAENNELKARIERLEQLLS